jgi:hypothetical protein
MAYGTNEVVLSHPLQGRHPRRSEIFCGFDDAHWREGGPGITAFRGELEAGVLEFGLVTRGVFEIGDDGGASGFQNAGNLLAGFVATFARGNVVDAGEGDDYVESIIGKSESGGVAIEYFDAVFYSFQFGVTQRALLFVGGKIDLAPEIDADGAASREALGCADHEQARAGADVEDFLVAAPIHHIQHAVAMFELSVHRVDQHQDAAGETTDRGIAEHRRKQEGHAAEGEVGQKAEEQQAKHARDKKIADYAGCIDTVVRFGGCVAHAARPRVALRVCTSRDFVAGDSVGRGKDTTDC